MGADTSSFCCFRCGSAYAFTDRIGRGDSCPRCDADLRCCMNCRHYSPNAHNQCNETQSEWVREKDRSNYCDYFEPRRGSDGQAANRGQDARAKFEDLFK